jgi:hypothetical protein
MSPETKTLLALIAVFVVVGLLITLVSFLLWLWRGRRQVIKAVSNRLSPSAMRGLFRAKLLNLLVFSVVGLIVAACVCFLSMSFGDLEFNSASNGETWLTDIITLLRPDPLRYVSAITEDGYEIAICFGLGIAVLAGFMLGGFVGKILGMKRATKQFRISEALL